MTQKKFFGILLYAGLSIISVWATGESISSSFGFPIVISYLAASMIIFVLASMLSIFKESLENKNLVALIFSVLVFFLLWVISLATNSHKFFTQLKLDDIRKNELNVALNELNNLTTGSTAFGNNVIKNYKQGVASRITSYYDEVANEANCGHGQEADRLKRMVEESMPGSFFNLLTGYGPGQCSQLASAMTNQMTDELNRRVADMKLSMEEIGACDDTTKRTAIQQKLENVQRIYDTRSTNEIKEALSEAHQYYNSLYDCTGYKIVQLPEQGTYGDLFPKKLKMPVPSIELERISALLPYINAHPEHKNSFWLGLGIAFVIDLAAFIIFYFMIMGPTNKW